MVIIIHQFGQETKGDKILNIATFMQNALHIFKGRATGNDNVARLFTH